MRLLSSQSSSLRLTVTALILVGSSAGLSACRLGANNSEKLAALKSGEIYDEDGVLSVEITSPADGTLINVAADSTEYAISGTCSIQGAPITATLDDLKLPAVMICADGKWSGVFNSVEAANGDHTLVATITSSKGSQKASLPIAFKKDASVPSLAITSPAAGSFINSATNSATFAVAGTCTESGQTVSVLIDGASVTQAGGSCNGTTWAATVSTLGLSAGSHTLAASVTSASGNPKTSADVLVTKDITVPTVAVSSPAASSYVNLGNNSASFAVNGTCNDSTASVQVKVDGSNLGTAATCGGVNWNTTINTSGLSEGAHTLTAHITDPAGNTVASSNVAITKDTTAPTISISSPSNNSYVNASTASATFAIQGACSATENGRSITIQAGGSNATQSAISCGTGSPAWSGTFSTNALSEGTHTLTAIVSDAAGNSTTSTGIVVTKDVTLPSVTLTFPKANMTINATTNSTAYPVTGTCNENTRAVSVMVDGVAAAGLASNTCSGGSFSATIDTSGLSNAAHTITATTTDAAGNSGPASPPSVTLSKDTTLAMAGTFARASVAQDPYAGTQAASGVARYPTVGGATGILVEEDTTNLVSNPHFNGVLTSWDQASNYGIYPFSVSGDMAFIGSNSAKATNGGASNTYSHTIKQAVSLTSGQKYTVSVWYHNPSAVSNNIIVGLETSNTYTIDSQNYPSTGATTGFTKYSYTMTAASTGTHYVKVLFYMTPGTSAYLGFVQVENKAYGTTPVVGVRASETFTVPTAGRIRASEGAIVIRAYVDGDQAAATTVFGRKIFDMGAAGPINRITLNMSAGTPGIYYGAMYDSSGASTFTTNYPAQLSKGWHYFALRWSSSRFGMWIDGVEQAFAATVALPNTLPATMGVGQSYVNNGQWGQPIDSIAFYQNAPTDAQMITYTTTGPSSSDDRLDFNGATFTRTSVAHGLSNGAQAASGKERYATSGASTGVVIEETTTNLVSANQSDIETNTTGFVANGGASITRSTAWAWQGSASLLIQGATCISSCSNVNMTTTNTLTSFTSGTTYAASFYAYNPNGSAITITTGFGGASSATKTIAAGATERITFTHTAASTGGTDLRFKEATGQAFHVDGLQVEEKLYPTNWTLGGNTRGQESLSLPKSSMVLSGTEGAIVIRAYLDENFIARTESGGQYLTHVWNGGNMRLYIARRGNLFRFLVQNSATAYFVDKNMSTITPGFHTVGLKYTASATKAYFDGAELGSTTGVAFDSDFLSRTITIGSGGFSLTEMNNLIDYAAFYTTAPSDADMLTFTGSAGPSNATVRFDFNGSLSQ